MQCRPIKAAMRRDISESMRKLAHRRRVEGDEEAVGEMKAAIIAAIRRGNRGKRE